MLQDINDVIIGRKTAEQVATESEEDNNHTCNDSGKGDAPEAKETQEPNTGTLILDATCAPQTIRFPTDTSLLNEARENTEEIIDSLHVAGLTDGKKPRTYRTIAKNLHNSFSKKRKKTKKSIQKVRKQQLNFLRAI